MSFNECAMVLWHSLVCFQLYEGHLFVLNSKDHAAVIDIFPSSRKVERSCLATKASITPIALVSCLFYSHLYQYWISGFWTEAISDLDWLFYTNIQISYRNNSIVKEAERLVLPFSFALIDHNAILPKISPDFTTFIKWHFSKVENTQEVDLKNNGQNWSSRGWDILIFSPQCGYYNSHNATQWCH